VAVEPVNDTTGMSGCFTIGAPAFGPVPNTKLTTPGGRPVNKKKIRGENSEMLACVANGIYSYILMFSLPEWFVVLK